METLEPQDRSRTARDFAAEIADDLPCMIAYYSSDFVCRFCNAPYLSWFESRLSPDTVVGTHGRDLLGEEQFAVSWPYAQRALAGEFVEFERTRISSGGETKHLLVQYKPDFGEENLVRGVYILATDVTSLKVAEAELREAASVYFNVSEGIAITDAGGKILSINKAFTEVTGFAEEEAVGHSMAILKSFRHPPEFYHDMWDEIGRTGRWQGEIWNRRKNGEVFVEWLAITRILDREGNPSRYVAVFNDISSIKSGDERLMHLVLHDALTGLPNRMLMQQRLEQVLSQHGRQPRMLAVMFLDLDGFKAVNDTLGHHAGDELLKVVAERLSAQVRASDTVARLGGDEFVVLLDDPHGEAEVINIAERIVATINGPVDLSGHSVRIGVSIGIVTYPSPDVASDELIQCADAAMYDAKRLGKNRYRFYVPAQALQAGSESSGWVI